MPTGTYQKRLTLKRREDIITGKAGVLCGESFYLLQLSKISTGIQSNYNDSSQHATIDENRNGLPPKQRLSDQVNETEKAWTMFCETEDH